MNYRVNRETSIHYLECLPDRCCVEDAQGVLDLMPAFYEYDTNLLLLYAENLSPDFFRLNTRLAGDIMQKLVNYHIKTALVMDTARIGQGRFKEMVLETNQGSHFRVFDNRPGAVKWLLGS